MDITNYTTYDDIRAALGVHDEEMEDSTLALALYANQLEQDFFEIDEDLQTDVDTLALAGSWTNAQKRLLNLTSLFATYSVAKELCRTVDMFAPKMITDGNAKTDRIVQFADTKETVLNAYAITRARLVIAYEVLYGVTSPNAVSSVKRVYALAAGISTDPVTQ